jgi:hypothetical protein
VWSDGRDRRTVKAHVTVYLDPLISEHRIKWVRELKKKEGGAVKWKEEKEKTRKEEYEVNKDNMRNDTYFLKQN